MSAAAPAPDAPRPSLEALHIGVQARLTKEVPSQIHGMGYWPLSERLQKVQQGTWSFNPVNDAMALEADLLELLEAPAEVLCRMVMHQAVSGRCMPPGTEMAMRATNAQMERDRAANALRPRISPAELLQAFAARGITVVKGPDGNLHVSPAGWLTEADRGALSANKMDLVAVLDGAPAVI